MSIRYKTAFIFLLSGLLPFLIIGTLVFIDFQNSLRNSTFRNLEAVTTLQEARVVDLLTIYSQGANYFGAQPMLREAVQSYFANPASPGAKARLTQSLATIVSSGSDGTVTATPIQALAITDSAGTIIDATEPFSTQKSLPVQTDRLLADIFRDQRGVHLLFGAPMVYEGKTLARFYMTINAQPLLNITGARDGLGETGETFLTKRSDDKTGIFVTPLRFDAEAAFKRSVSLADTNRPSAEALLKQDRTFTSGVVSYRGHPVIAVTRYIPQAGLGIIGQMDQIEAFEPVHNLAVQVVVFVALLSLLTIFIGSFMAEIFTRPVLHLAIVASKLRKGDFSARAKISSHDELGQLGHAFNVMAGDLAKQDQAKSDIIALISHQLRTPVTAVKGFVSLVLQGRHGRISDDDAKMLRLAFGENEKLNKLITQILEVAHADSGKFAIEPVPTNIVRLVHGVTKEFQPMLRLRQQTLKLSPASEPIMVSVDPEKISFVLDILLTNASKYSPEGSVVTVKISHQERICRIHVTDKGLGISPENQAKLFQKFSRIRNSQSDTAEGVGLGLYMAKKIVELHKGSITVSSSENHGARFTIELPTNV
jgi:signal transduction histidine kinase